MASPRLVRDQEHLQNRTAMFSACGMSNLSISVFCGAVIDHLQGGVTTGVCVSSLFVYDDLGVKSAAGI